MNRVKRTSRLWENYGRAEHVAFVEQRQRHRKEKKMRLARALLAHTEEGKRLRSMTYAELQAEASRVKLRGRSKMNKKELLRALLGG